MRATAAFGALLLMWGGDLSAQTMRTLTAARPLAPGAPPLRAQLDFGAGRVVLRSGNGNDLYRMLLRYDTDRYAPVQSYDPRTGHLHLGVTSVGRGGLRVTSRGQLEQVARFEFAPTVPLSLTALLGASDAALDLGDLTLRSLEVRSGATRGLVDFSQPTRGECSTAIFAVGAAELDVMRLANAGCAEVVVEGGVGRAVLDFGGTWRRNTKVTVALAMGTATVRVPRGSGVRIHADRFLTSISGEGLVRSGDHWATVGFEQATQRIEVELKTSVAGVDVQWID